MSTCPQVNECIISEGYILIHLIYFTSTNTGELRQYCMSARQQGIHLSSLENVRNFRYDLVKQELFLLLQICSFI